MAREPRPLFPAGAPASPAAPGPRPPAPPRPALSADRPAPPRAAAGPPAPPRPVLPVPPDPHAGVTAAVAALTLAEERHRPAIHAAARQLAAAAPLEVLRWGEAAQERAAALPDAILRAAAEGHDTVRARLAALRRIVGALDPDDLRPRAGALARASGALRDVLDGEPRARLAAALHAAEAEERALRDALPALAAGIAHLDGLAAEAEAAAAGIEVTLRAAEAVRDAGAAADPDALAGRIDSLRLSGIALAGDPVHLRNLRASRLALTEATRGALAHHLGLWKRACAASLAAAPGSAWEGVAGVARARAGVLGALAAATGERNA